MTWDENRVRTQIREVLKKRSTIEIFFKSMQDEYRDTFVKANEGLKLMDSALFAQILNQYPDLKPFVDILKGFGISTTRVSNDFRFLHCILEELALAEVEASPQRQDVISQEDRNALDWLKKYISSAKTEGDV